MSYIKLDRKLLNWEWFTDINTAHLWIYILLKANHKEKEWRGIKIKEGTFITSSLKMSAETGLTRQQIRTSLYKLISTNEITKISTNEYTQISVNKWADYQYISEKLTNEATTETTSQSTSEITTTKEYKEDKEFIKKEINKERKFIAPTIEQVKQYCQERNNLVDPQRFIDFYEAKGWMIGKNKMKDWKAAVRTWEQREKPKEEVELTDTIGIQYDASENPIFTEERKQQLANRRKYES